MAGYRRYTRRFFIQRSAATAVAGLGLVAIPGERVLAWVDHGPTDNRELSGTADDARLVEIHQACDPGMSAIITYGEYEQRRDARADPAHVLNPPLFLPEARLTA